MSPFWILLELRKIEAHRHSLFLYPPVLTLRLLLSCVLSTFNKEMMMMMMMMMMMVVVVMIKNQQPGFTDLMHFLSLNHNSVKANYM